MAETEDRGPIGFEAKDLTGELSTEEGAEAEANPEIVGLAETINEQTTRLIEGAQGMPRLKDASGGDSASDKELFLLRDSYPLPGIVCDVAHAEVTQSANGRDWKFTHGRQMSYSPDRSDITIRSEGEVISVRKTKITRLGKGEDSEVTLTSKNLDDRAAIETELGNLAKKLTDYSERLEAGTLNPGDIFTFF